MFSHDRKYVVAFVSQEGEIVRTCPTRLSLREAVAYLDSHERRPNADGEPCILSLFRRAADAIGVELESV